MRLAALALLLACTRAKAPVPDDAEWSRLVAALQQVAEEYNDALELDDEVAAARRRDQLVRFLDQTPVPSEVQRDVAAVRARMLGTDYALGDAVRSALARIFERTRLQRVPRQKPELANGRRLFAQSCAPCHGPDGQSAPIPEMDPPPPNILHPGYNWTPYEMFNRVTYGGIETAMPSFAEGLTESERWDIVFYLFAERWPPCTKPLPPMSARDLALLGDFELGNSFGYGAAACLRRDFAAPE